MNEILSDLFFMREREKEIVLSLYKRMCDETERESVICEPK